jgi:MFS family permease
MTDRNPCLWSRPFILIIALTFLFFLCLHMMNAAFPVFVTQFSHSPGLGGMMTAAFMMAAIMIRPFVGLFLPQINSQKMIMLSLALIFVCIIVSYGAQQVLCLFALRAVEGIGFGIVSTLLATKATGLIPTARMGEGMGFFGMATSLGASLAAVSALSLLHAYSFHAVILAAALLIIGIFAGSLLLPASSTDPSSLPLREKKVAASYIFDQNAMLPSTLVFLLCVTFGGVFNFINGLGEEVGLEA